MYCARIQILKREKLLPPLTQLFNLVSILHEHMDDLESMFLNPISSILVFFLRDSPDLLQACYYCHVKSCRTFLYLW